MTIRFAHGVNHPGLIETYLKAGYGVEVDVRVRQGKFYSGHDEPIWLLPLEKFYNFANQRFFLFHAKDLQTFQFLHNNKMDGLHFFFQDKDDICLSSWGYFILHSNVRLPRDYRDDEIAVLPTGGHGKAYGVVVDVSKEINCKVVAA